MSQLPRPGRALRHPLHHRRRDPGRAQRRRHPARLGRRRRPTAAKSVILAMGAAAQAARPSRRDRARRPRRLHLRRLRRSLLQGPGGDRRRRRRLGDGGRDLHRQVREQARRSSIAATSSAPRRSCSSAPRRRRTSSSRRRSRPRSSSRATSGKLEQRRLRQHRDRRGARRSRSAAPSSRSATSPARSWSKGQIDLHDNGYVKTDEPSTRTNLAGVFAVGDLVDFTYRQAVTAAGSGCRGRARRRVVPARHAADRGAGRGHRRGLGLAGRLGRLSG